MLIVVLVLVLTLQLPLLVVQLLVLSSAQLATWTDPGTTPAAISCHGATKNAIPGPALLPPPAMTTGLTPSLISVLLTI